MLQIENRLKKVRDFNLLMKHGRWVSGDFVKAKILDLSICRQSYPKKTEPDEFSQQLRIAFGVGLKVTKSAVKRNRLKRQLREVVRLLIKDEKIKLGCYVLLNPIKIALEKNYSEIEREIIGIFKKGRIYK